MRRTEHVITKVLPGGIAEEMGVEPGMTLISINGQEVEDVFDYRYLMSGEHVDVLIREEDGTETVLEIDKEPYEEFGVEFAEGLMDDYKSCSNRCIFCFIDQMPKGMRSTLYFKDDDSRLSFLQGNYITLTNMSDKDIDRIIKYRMEPINISVQTTNPELRAKMLGNRFAGRVFPKLKRLADANIIMNGQIVLCKGYNDGAELDRSIRDLTGYLPAMQSVSVVPVGLSKFRDGLTKLEPFTKEDAEEVIDLIEGWQNKIWNELDEAYRKKCDKEGLIYEDGADPSHEETFDVLGGAPRHFIHASDEWYLLAERELPEAGRYDGYLQYENGVGMLRLLHDEVEETLNRFTREGGLFGEAVPVSTRRVTIATGRLAAPYIEAFAAKVTDVYPWIDVNVVPIRNDFFGESITVSGLITGVDLIGQLKERKEKGESLGDELLIPVNMLRQGETVFLDDMTTDDVEDKLDITIRIVWTEGENFVRALLGLPEIKEKDRQIYE